MGTAGGVHRVVEAYGEVDGTEGTAGNVIDLTVQEGTQG